MSERIITFAIVVSMVLVGKSAWAQDKQVERARQQVNKAQVKLKEAKIDSAADYNQFVKDARIDINENKKSIAALKLKKTESNRADRKQYDKKVLALEKRK